MGNILQQMSLKIHFPVLCTALKLLYVLIIKKLMLIQTTLEILGNTTTLVMPITFIIQALLTPIPYGIILLNIILETKH